MKDRKIKLLLALSALALTACSQPIVSTDNYSITPEGSGSSTFKINGRNDIGVVEGERFLREICGIGSIKYSGERGAIAISAVSEGC